MAELSEKHHEVYKSFCFQHDLIVSLPHLFRRGNTLGRAACPLAVKQKLPHRLFAGVTTTQDAGRCNFRTILSYDAQHQTFVTKDPLEEISYVTRIEEALSRLLTSLEVPYGIDFSFLSEYGRGQGSSYTSVLITLCVSAIFILLGKVSPGDLVTYETFLQSAAYEDLCFLASYLKHRVTGKKGSCVPFVALRKGMQLILQAPDIDFDRLPEELVKKNLFHLGKLCKEVYPEYTGGVFGDLTGSSDFLFVPIDISIVSYGPTAPFGQEQVLNMNHDQQHPVQQVEVLLGNADQKMDLDQYVLDAHEVCTHTSTVLLTRLIQSRTACVLADHSNQDMQVHALLQAVQDTGVYQSSLEQSYERPSLLHQAFLNAQSSDDERFGAIALTPTKHAGSFLLITPYRQSRTTIEKMCASGLSSPTCLYASWKHGFGQEGLVVQQFLSKSIYSNWVTPTTVALSTGDKKLLLDEYHHLLEQVTNRPGLVCDLIKKKIYLRGEKIAHTTLCSQSATIEILQILCDNLGAYVANHNLPTSSYSRNKNELIGKIVGPLNELFQKEFGETLDILYAGTMYEYSVCLRKKPNNIYFISYAKPVKKTKD